MLPLSRPVSEVNGKQINELFIPEGTNIFVTILSVNRDKELWGSDALEWKPERWLTGLPEEVKKANIPGVYLNT